MAEIDRESLLATHPLIDEIARQCATEMHLPGMQWGVVLDGELVLVGSVGAITDHSTRYRIASMTKSFTAAAVLSLRDEGVLALDVPVGLYAPELKGIVGPDSSPPITLRHLLSMSSGLATDDAWADRHLDATTDEMNRIYADGPEFAFATGTNFEYSNLGFALIGRVVERVTGRKVRDHIDERFLGPLSMSATTWDQPHHAPWAEPLRLVDDTHIADGAPLLGNGEISPMGGLWSTVADVARWLCWLDEANAGRDSLTGQLSIASRRDMQSVHTFIGDSELDGQSAPGGYGFGLLLRDDPLLGMTVSHSGGLPGYGSNMRWLYGRGLGVVGLSNVTYAPMGVFTQRVLKLFHSADLIHQPITPLTPLLQQRVTQLIELLSEWNDDQARSLFADNVELDTSFMIRQMAAERIVAECGRLQVEEIQAKSRTSATVILRGATGQQRIKIELSPKHGGLVQWYGTSA
jgi:CubicO group peptidase (beta-lactamase class C family)